MNSFNTLTEIKNGPPVGNLQSRIAKEQTKTRPVDTTRERQRPPNVHESTAIAARAATASMVEMGEDVVSWIQDISPYGDERSTDSILRGLQGAHITHGTSVSDVEARNVAARRPVIDISSGQEKIAV